MIESILKGVYVCLIIQIAIIGVVNLFQRVARNRILGVFCFLLIFSLVKRAFWNDINESNLYYLFGGPHEILYAPLLYTYLLIADKKILSNTVYNHILIAFFIYLILHLLAVFFFKNNHYVIAPFFLLSILIFSIAYFIKGLKLYKYQLKTILKPYPRIRFQFFYVSANLYILLKAFVVLIAFINAVIENPILKTIYQNFSLPVFYYVVVPLFILLCLTYIFYGLTEINGLKRTILNIDIHKKDRQDDLKYDIIWKLLKVDQIYTNPNLNFNDFVKEVQLSKATVSQFLEDNSFENFQDLINRFRIEDFKGRVKDHTFDKYDLISIAKESGFKSKATFYRVFKKQEHMTPREYLQSL